MVPLRRSGRGAAYVSILGALGAFVSAVMAWRAVDALGEPLQRVWTWLPQQQGALATIGILADETSTLMLLLVTLVALLVQMYSLGYLSDEPPAALGRYYAYQSLFAFSMMGLVLAPNLLQLFICWELVGLCSYLLIGFWYRKASAARAAVKAFWTTKLGDVGLLIGIVLLWRLTGTFDFGELRTMVDRRPTGRERQPLRDHLLPLSRRGGQVGAVPAARLAAGRDGRPDAGLGVDSRRDDGDRGRVSCCADGVALRADAGRPR